MRYKEQHFLQPIDKSQKKCSLGEHIEDFQKSNIRATDIPQEHRIDVFIGNLKDNIQHEVRVWELDSLEKAFSLEIKIERKIMATRKPTTHKYKDRSVVTPRLPQPTRLIVLRINYFRES